MRKITEVLFPHKTKKLIKNKGDTHTQVAPKNVNLKLYFKSTHLSKRHRILSSKVQWTGPFIIK